MIIKYFQKILIYKIIIFIKLYQLFFSPFLKSNCRFLPTYSDYTIDALNEYGLFKGCYYSFKRIVSCHPFGKYGYDPISKKLEKHK